MPQFIHWHFYNTSVFEILFGLITGKSYSDDDDDKGSSGRGSQSSIDASKKKSEDDDDDLPPVVRFLILFEMNFESLFLLGILCLGSFQFGIANHVDGWHHTWWSISS